MPFWSKKDKTPETPAARTPEPRQPARPPRVAGRIGYLGLGDWWLTAFTPEERDYIRQTVGPDIDQGEILSWGGSATMFLSNTAGWFRKPENQHLADLMLAKAEQIEGDPLLDRHFLWQQVYQTYWRIDGDPERQAVARQAVERQIAISQAAAAEFLREYPGSPLPGHAGYTALVMDLERQGDFDGAIAVVRRCAAEGWAGCSEDHVAGIEASRARHLRKIEREQKRAAKNKAAADQTPG